MGVSLTKEEILSLVKEKGIKLSFLNDLIHGYRGKMTDWKNGKTTLSDTELKTITNYLLGIDGQSENSGGVFSMFWDIFCKECDKVNKKPNKVAMELGLSGATTTKWKAGTIPNGETLVKIADYFNCSTDYLLGRTDDPTPTPHGNVSGDNSFQNIQDSPVINKHSTAPPENKPDGVTSEFMRVFENLDFDDKVELMGLAVKMKKGA